MTAVSSKTATVTPKHLVYQAWTTPELVERWWSGERGHVTLAKIDLRVGGKWRYLMVAHGGFEVGFHGEYREIVPNERIVATEIYEGGPDDEGALTTATFTESGGRTTLELVMELPTKEDRDMVINTGMETGLQEGFDRLEQVAISLL